MKRTLAVALAFAVATAAAAQAQGRGHRSPSGQQGGGRATPRSDGGSSGGARSSGGRGSQSTGGTSSGSGSPGAGPVSSGSGASSAGAGSSDADRTARRRGDGTGSGSHNRPGQGTADHAVERRPDTRAPTVIITGWGYGGRGFYPWGYGGLGLGGYYGVYDPWWYDEPPYAGRYDYGYGDQGSLRLKIKPREATVYVDGYYAGVVDDYDGVFQRLHIDAGPHRIEVRDTDFEPLMFEVRIQPSRTVTYKGTLKPLP